MKAKDCEAGEILTQDKKNIFPPAARNYFTFGNFYTCLFQAMYIMRKSR